jgi:hypothetical protein
MATPTMFYRPFVDGSDVTKCIENEAGKWEWQIVEIEDGDAPPEGWKSLPVVIEASETVSEPEKPAKRKKKTEAEPVADEAVDGDGN